MIWNFSSSHCSSLSQSFVDSEWDFSHKCLQGDFMHKLSESHALRVSDFLIKLSKKLDTEKVFVFKLCSAIQNKSESRGMVKIKNRMRQENILRMTKFLSLWLDWIRFESILVYQYSVEINQFSQLIVSKFSGAKFWQKHLVLWETALGSSITHLNCLCKVRNRHESRQNCFKRNS